MVKTYLSQRQCVQTIPQYPHTTSSSIIFVKSTVNKHELAFPYNWLSIINPPGEDRGVLTIATGIVDQGKWQNQRVQQHEEIRYGNGQDYPVSLHR